MSRPLSSPRSAPSERPSLLSLYVTLLTAALWCEQAAALQVQIHERQRRGEAKMDTQGNFTDRTTRILEQHIRSLERPLKADEEEQAALIAKERAFRETAMQAYRRQGILSALCTSQSIEMQSLYHAKSES